VPGDGEGGKEAFCLLLWKYNGGVVTPALGILRHSFDQEGLLPKYVRGYCTRPGDCFSCPTMQEEIAKHVPGKALWVCSDCVDVLLESSRSAGLPFHLPGYYTEGQCQNPGCPRPTALDSSGRVMKDDEGNDLPSGWSRFLQLFIQG